MKIETRKREFGRVDLLIIATCREDSEIIDLLTQPKGRVDVKLESEVRLSDGYGEHYILIKGEDHPKLR